MGTLRDVASVGLYIIMLPYNTFLGYGPFSKYVLIFLRLVILCNPGWPRVHYEDQPGFKLRDPPAFFLPGAGVKDVPTLPGF